MRTKTWTRTLVVQSLLSVVIGTTGKVYGDAPAAKWYDTVAFSGYVQGSYVGNLAAPSSKLNTNRLFDDDSNSFNLNAYHLQLQKPVGDDGVGFTTKLLMGRDARKIKSTGWSDQDFDVHEAYLTYVPQNFLGKKLSLSAGKFVTLEGLEVIESPMNPNFSEGLLFVFGEPFTHTGIKGTYTFNDKVNATVGVVNGWDTSKDANDGKTVIWQIATTPFKMATLSLQGTYGPEALADNLSKRTSIDALAGLMPTDKLSLWLQGNFGQDTHVTRAGTGDAFDVINSTTAGSSTARWSGLGVWAQYAVNSWLTEALRFEVFNDQGGANRLGNGVNETMKEITWTHKFQLAKNLFTRLEYRHDWSNQGVFTLHEPGRTGSVQNTISADWVVTF